MEELFGVVLDKDETIQKVYKPCAAKAFLKSILLTALIMLFMCGTTCLGMFVPEEGGESLPAVWAVVPAGVFVVAEILCIWLTSLWCKKTFYAYSDKRLIIRTGIIGVDFKCLDLKSIGAADVSVSLLDKILGKNTGSIRFGSMSSPINSEKAAYSFSHILAPYETYREIKEIIESKKA